MTSNANNGRFVWYENLTNEPEAAIRFYTDVMGWTTQRFPESGGDYVMWVGSQGPLGGVMKIPAEAAGAPPLWMAHVHVANVDETAKLGQKLGGKVHKEPTDIPTVGRFAVVADPQGALLSVFTPTTEMTLHDTSKAGEFCWNELMTSNSQGAVEFYSQMFGWRIVQELDMGPVGTYRIFGLGDRQMGGIMKMPEGVPVPMWIYYTETPDVEAAIARARKHGGTLLNGPMDVPGGGRIAQLSDPQGAAFALHQSPKTS